MTTLDLSTPGELRLILRGAAEDAILSSLRRWPHWLRAEVERDPADGTQCIAVILIADRTQESTIREILRRGFGLIFPSEGGDTTLKPVPTRQSHRRGFA